MGHGSREWENPDLPLSDQERQQNPIESGVLPSGEAGFFDVAQLHANRPFSRIAPDDTDKDFGIFGIDTPFPYTSDVQYGAELGSGLVVQSYSGDISIPESLVDPEKETGIFHPSALNIPFSDNTPVPSGLGDRIRDYKRPQQFKSSITSEPEYSFRVMDSYIHHKVYKTVDNGGEAAPIEIQFLSTYDAALDYNRYGSNFASYYSWGGS